MNNFRSRREVEQVRRLVLAGQVVKPGQTGGIPALICKTASGGIPARSGNVAGIADDVMVQTINADGTMEDSDREITVYNPFGTAVSGSVYITCKFVNNGYWIVDAEDC
jgi:hypothetical protein